MTKQIYSNQITIKKVCYDVAIYAVLMAIIYFADESASVGHFIFVGLMILCPIVFRYFFWPRNNYVIDDNYLVVEEFDGPKRYLYQRILIADIDKVSYAWSFYHCQRVVKLVVGNTSIHLESVSHTKELYAALNQQLSKQ